MGVLFNYKTKPFFYVYKTNIYFLEHNPDAFSCSSSIPIEPTFPVAIEGQLKIIKYSTAYLKTDTFYFDILL